MKSWNSWTSQREVHDVGDSGICTSVQFSLRKQTLCDRQRFGHFSHLKARSRGISLDLLKYFIQHCFICRTSDSVVLEDAGTKPRTWRLWNWQSDALTTRIDFILSHLSPFSRPLLRCKLLNDYLLSILHSISSMYAYFMYDSLYSMKRILRGLICIRLQAVILHTSNLSYMKLFPSNIFLLLILEALNVLYRDNWTQLASQEIIKMQTELFHSIRQQVITSGRSRSYNPPSEQFPNKPGSGSFCHNATKIPFMYSPKRNCAASLSQFPHSCVCERFIYSQNRST